MALFLGCDVCKTKIDVALVNDLNQILWQDVVANRPDVLAQYLLTLMEAYPEELVTGIVEATGRYHYPLLEASLAVNFAMKVYNPILTKQGIKTSIRGQKTDKTDAILIARLGLRGEGRLYTKEPYMVAKLQTRSYAKLGEMKGSFKKHVDHLTAMNDQVMNERVSAVFRAVEDAIEQARKQLYYELQHSTEGNTFTSLQTIPGIGPLWQLALLVKFKT